MRGVLVLFLLGQLLCGCVTMTQIRLDAEVDRRCREDGGLKVYETAPLPPKMFNEHGYVTVPSRFEGDLYIKDLGPDYIWKDKTRFLHGGYEWESYGKVISSPSLSRYHYQIFRRADGKLLGEMIGYSRYGGDPFWARFTGVESSHRCPQSGYDGPLLNGVFYKEGRP